MTDKRLLSYLERIERLATERAGITDDIRDVVTEATSAGYDAPTLRKLLALRGMDVSDREESEYLLDTYKSAIGMGDAPDLIGDGTRLGRAAAMFRDGKKVKQVAVLMDLSNGTAGRLRKRAEALGLLKPHPIPSQKRGMSATVHDLVTGEITQSEAPTKAATAAIAGEREVTAPDAASDPIPEPPAGGQPPLAGPTQAVAAPPSAIPAGAPDKPMVSVSVHRNGETLADSGPMPMAAFKALAAEMPELPAKLKRGTPENDALRRL